MGMQNNLGNLQSIWDKMSIINKTFNADLITFNMVKGDKAMTITMETLPSLEMDIDEDNDKDSDGTDNNSDSDI